MPSFLPGRLGLVAIAAALLAAAPRTGAGDDDGPVDFARDVRPILEERCFKCHSGEKPKSGLRLDARKRALRGGNSGEKAIVGGHPEKSRLLELVKGEKEGERMPPKGDPLTAEQIALLQKWIEQGAPWPDLLSGDELVKEHWAFVEPVKPRLPDSSTLKRAWWPKCELDLFTLERMEEHGLAPSPEADRATLARRVSLDLIGLPPTPAELDTFVTDRATDAYERYVRRLLESPRYGERWASVWLDLARYADSCGYGQDPLRPFMWRWRDWVIDAFNGNEPFDRFTIEQLAGDLLPEPSLDQLLATAFHRNTMTNTEGGTVDEEFRVAAVKDRIESTMQIWMGLTFGCAKCHSHKFDPIPQKDYYRFFAFFNQTEDSDRPDDEPRIATPTQEQQARRAGLAAKLADVARRRDALAANLAEGQARWERDVAAGEGRWIALHPTAAKSVEGAELSIDADGSVRATGPAPATDRYVVAAAPECEGADAASFRDVTAFRLEALDDPGLPRGGPGRSPENGNFVVSDFRVIAAMGARQPLFARWVRIENPGRQKILSLAEVQLFSSGENVALHGRASQSSVDYEGEPGRAIDGNTDGRYLEARSTTHNRVEDDPWWEVDLGSNRRIDRIVVWNRTDGNLQFRLAGMRVTLLGEGHGGEADRITTWQGLFPDAADPSIEIDPTGPAIVSLERATADFEQEGFPVAAAIDGDRGAKSGWAIGPQQGRAHVAVFETRTPLRAASGLALRFEIAQEWGQQHTLGRFRISVCTGTEPPRALPQAVAAALAQPAASRSDEQRRVLADHYRGIAPELAPFNEEAKPLEEALAALDQEIVRTPVMRELAPEKRRTTHLLVKSNYLAPGDLVEPTVPAAFPPLPQGAPSNRLGVALWLVSPENPLTARVTVNRFWAQLFGRGLVETEEDFGTQGTPPTHPELLDWLACRFVESGWNVKELLFTIVTSATYRQSSRADEAMLALDPRDVWLERFPRRRLEAEMVRDQALAVAGLLAPKLRGPSVYPPQPDGLWQVAFNGERTYPTSTGEDRWRRSLYSFWRRTVPPPSMQTFDAPSREYCTVRRQSTNTPLQAFVTLNDPCFVEAAQALARRIVRETRPDGSTDERAAFALRLALAREPEQSEIAVLADLFRSERARLLAGDPAAARALAEQPLGPLPPDLDPIELAAWTTVANVVLNLDAVLTKS